MSKRHAIPDMDAPAAKRIYHSPSCSRLSRPSTPLSILEDLPAVAPTFHDGQEIVVVVAGREDDKKSFFVHAELLKNHSEYFGDSVNIKAKAKVQASSETEPEITDGDDSAAGPCGAGLGATNSITLTIPLFHLPTIEHITFGIFVSWLYKLQITASPSASPSTTPLGSPSASPSASPLAAASRPSLLSLLALAKLYILSKTLLLAPQTTTYLLSVMHLAKITTSPPPSSSLSSALSEFSHFCYEAGDAKLEALAIRKTMESFGRRDIGRVVKGMPERMVGAFLGAVMVNCAKLPGWEDGGFEGVWLEIDPWEEFALEVPVSEGVGEGGEDHENGDF